ncbi:tetratricopeptide repeat protein [Glaciimonas immobilis]|uniref:MSHA biogenesis protein MshN n=1 Tax=Glaciimonas immobilis TaxID=728004 RepID=A0A840RNU3_9BURK|nr:tetratricopeptide repeat protein [Glaciimonas immobilis]KAF3998987.1 tetratricopeptide repeat protein [Glaciimonas immobilis]MBB5198404.1 MSHA biogenesis protein MshN [Glaciimonas immobilis]
MSLINQMLRDLDKRGESAPDLPARPGYIKVIPKPPGNARLIWATVLLVLACCVLLVWWYLGHAQPLIKPMLKPAVLAQPAPPAQPQSLNAIPEDATPPKNVVLPAAGLPVAPMTATALPSTNTIQQKSLEVTAAPQNSSTTIAPSQPLMPMSAPAANALVKNEVKAKDLNFASDASETSHNGVINPTVDQALAATKERKTPHVSDAKIVTKKSVNISAQDSSMALRPAKEITPQQAIDNRYRKAISLIDAGQLPQAIELLQQVLQLDPKHAAARQTLVGLLLQGKRQDEAVRMLQEGLSNDPSLTGMAMILARLQVERGSTRIATETLAHSLPYALENAEYQAFFAALLQRDKRNKEAIEHYAIALRKVPENGLWWMGYGISLQAENRLPEAEDAFTRAKSSSTLSAELLTFVNQKLHQIQR